MTINGAIIHPSVTLQRVCDAVEEAHRNQSSPGFCVLCGAEAEGCEEQTERCETCDASTVYPASALLVALWEDIGPGPASSFHSGLRAGP